MGQAKDTVDDLVELEVRAQHLRVDIIVLHLQLMGIIGEVPRLKLEVIAFELACFFTNSLHLLFSGRLVGINEVVEKLIDILHAARHAVFHHIVGKGVVAQELCLLTPVVDESAADVAVVVLVAMGAERVAGHIQLSSQLAVVGVRHKRRVAGIVECEQPAFFALFLGSVGGSLHGRVGKSGQVVLVSDEQCEGLGILQQVLRELQGEQRSFL